MNSCTLQPDSQQLTQIENIVLGQQTRLLEAIGQINISQPKIMLSFLRRFRKCPKNLNNLIQPKKRKDLLLAITNCKKQSRQRNKPQLKQDIVFAYNLQSYQFIIPKGLILLTMGHSPCLLLFLWYSLCWIPSHSSPTLSYYIADSKCTFYYASNASDFTFIYCTIPGSYDARWIHCHGLCCPNSKSQDGLQPSYRAFLQCKKEKKNETSTILAAIVTSIFIGVCLCLFCIGRVFRRMRGNRNRVQSEDKPITAVEWQGQTEINNSIDNVIWSSKASKDSILRPVDQPCSICLDDHTNAELFCGHQYHPKCIGQWLQKNNCCPNCRLPHIKGIKCYCPICKSQYLVCSRLLISRHSSDLPTSCPLCSEQPDNQDGHSLAQILPVESKENLREQQPQRRGWNDEVNRLELGIARQSI